MCSAYDTATSLYNAQPTDAADTCDDMVVNVDTTNEPKQCVCHAIRVATKKSTRSYTNTT